MPTKVFPLRATPEEHEIWKRAASAWSFNGWARRTLNDRAAEVLGEEIERKGEARLKKQEARHERRESVAEPSPASILASLSAVPMSHKRTFKPDPKR